MNYAIIAAGEGSRLSEEGIRIPKPLVEINGIAMIKRLLDVFEKVKANQISIIINESIKEVKEYIESLNYDFKLSIKVKSTPSSMHSLFEMKELIGDDAFCLCTVDTVFKEAEFKSFIKFAEKQKDKDAVMAVTSFVDDEKPLFVNTREDKVIAFADKNSDSQYVSGGIYYFKPIIWKVLNQSIASGNQRMRNFQRDLLKADLNIGFYEFSKIIDVDHADDIKTAENFINSNKY